MKNIVAIVLTGLAGFLMHPTVLFGWHVPDCGFLAWVYLLPLFYQLIQNPKKSFRYSFYASFLFYSGSLYWLVVAMSRFGGLGMLTSLGVFFLVVFIASMLFALAINISFRIWQRSGLPLVLILPLALVGLDYLRTYFPVGGFPWPMAAYSQTNSLILFQWAEVTGVWGVSFLLLLVNVALAEIAQAFFIKKEADRVIKYSIVTVAVLVFSFGSSLFLQNRWDKLSEKSVSEINVGLIQGNISQDLKWDPQSARRHLKTYFSLSASSYAQGADIVFWPETAYPYSVDLSNYLQEPFFKSQEGSPPMVLGAVSEKPVPYGYDSPVYNSAILIGSDGRAIDAYHKRHLVPFGEYVPLKNWLTFAKTLTVQVGDMIPGENDGPFNWQGKKIGMLICYEDIFPELSRKTVEKGAELLAVLSNDAWYGMTSAPFQHLAFSQFRALENRRMLVRSTNTGVTAVINAHGEIEQQLPLFQEGVLTYLVDLNNNLSLYTRFGDWFVWVCIGGIILILLVRRKQHV